jgi:isopenicillin N synthase-like dioxygenase/dienelactone hydrolase
MAPASAHDKQQRKIMSIETISIPIKDGRTVSGALARAAAPNAPAVILIHEWWGQLPETRQMAEQIAARGYTTLAVDLYDGRTTQDPAEAGQLMNALDPARTTATLTAWAHWLREQGAPKLATLGFCMGGTWSLNTSLATPIDATVIFYGWVVRPPEEMAPLSGAVLAHFGTRDEFVPRESAAQLDASLTAAAKPHEVYSYPAGHAFARESGPHYDKEAARLAWDRTDAFLRKQLQPAAAQIQLPPSRQASFSEIPVISIAALGQGNAADAATVDSIRKAAEQVGFFYVTDHGVDKSEVDAIFANCARLFALPKAELEKVHISKSRTFSGFMGVGERGANQNRPRDLLEAYNFCTERSSEDPVVRAGTPLAGTNLWPGEDVLPGFRAAVLKYYASMDKLGHRLLQAFAMALGLPRDAFDHDYRAPISQLRLLHYPAQEGAIAEMLGARPHRDTGMFTILLQDEVGGLEVANAAGDWIVAPPVPGTFVVNVGEMMKLLTNDHFASALHRVVNRYGRQRFSVPFFFNPDYGTRLSTLPQYVDAERPLRFQPVNVGEHMFNFYRNMWPSTQAAPGSH